MTLPQQEDLSQRGPAVTKRRDLSTTTDELKQEAHSLWLQLVKRKVSGFISTDDVAAFAAEFAQRLARPIVERVARDAVKVLLMRHSSDIDIHDDAPTEAELEQDVVNVLLGDDLGCLDSEDVSDENCTVLIVDKLLKPGGAETGGEKAALKLSEWGRPIVYIAESSWYNGVTTNQCVFSSREEAVRWAKDQGRGFLDWDTWAPRGKYPDCEFDSEQFDPTFFAKWDDGFVRVIKTEVNELYTAEDGEEES